MKKLLPLIIIILFAILFVLWKNPFGGDRLNKEVKSTSTNQSINTPSPTITPEVLKINSDTNLESEVDNLTPPDFSADFDNLNNI